MSTPRHMLVFTVPPESADAVLAAIFEAGAGRIGDYAQCAFHVEGTGQFRPLTGADPTIGAVGELERVAERRYEVPFPAEARDRVVAALVEAHPYEEPSYFVIATV